MALAVQVDVYVLSGCSGEDLARRTADQIRRDWGDLCTVSVLDLADPGTERPESVFATPTYLVNGRVISLGTPSQVELTTAIRRAQLLEYP